MRPKMIPCDSRSGVRHNPFITIFGGNEVLTPVQKRNMWIGIAAALFTIVASLGRFGEISLANVVTGQYAIILVAVGAIITARLRNHSF